MNIWGGVAIDEVDEAFAYIIKLNLLHNFLVVRRNNRPVAQIPQ